MTARLSGGGDEPKSGGGNVSRDSEITGLWDLVAENADRVIFLAHGPDQEIIQHQFRVVPADEWLMHGRLAFREKPGQKERAFHLRTGDRRVVPRAPQFHAMDFDRRGLETLLCMDD